MPQTPTMPDPFAPAGTGVLDDVDEVPIGEVLNRIVSALGQVDEFARAHARTLSATRRHLIAQQLGPARDGLTKLAEAWDLWAEPE